MHEGCISSGVASLRVLTAAASAQATARGNSRSWRIRGVLHRAPRALPSCWRRHLRPRLSRGSLCPTAAICQPRSSRDRGSLAPERAPWPPGISWQHPSDQQSDDVASDDRISGEGVVSVGTLAVAAFFVGVLASTEGFGATASWRPDLAVARRDRFTRGALPSCSHWHSALAASAWLPVSDSGSARLGGRRSGRAVGCTQISRLTTGR